LVDRGDGRRRGVLDVDVGPDATTAAADWEPTPSSAAAKKWVASCRAPPSRAAKSTDPQSARKTVHNPAGYKQHNDDYDNHSDLGVLRRP
jgi:hypothetical protein